MKSVHPIHSMSPLPENINFSKFALFQTQTEYTDGNLAAQKFMINVCIIIGSKVSVATRAMGGGGGCV